MYIIGEQLIDVKKYSIPADDEPCCKYRLFKDIARGFLLVVLCSIGLYLYVLLNGDRGVENYTPQMDSYSQE